MVKALVIIVIAVIAFPFVVLWLRAPTFEDMEQAFNDAGLDVQRVDISSVRSADPVEQASMDVSGASVSIRRYESSAKLSVDYEYEKKDAGTAIVEAWNLSENLGAAKSQAPPYDVVKNGKFLMVVSGYDDDVRRRIREAFGRL